MNAARLITELRLQSPVAASLLIDNSMIGELHMLTQERLREILKYDPETGFLTWKEKISDKVNIGAVAGTKNDQGYILISINKQRYRAHRLAWLYVYGEWPDEIDHKNHIRGDNKMSNLRDVSHSVNGKNYLKSKRNKSGITGVYFDKSRDKWAAEIFVDGVKIHLGRHECKFEAACIRKSAERKHNFHINHGAHNGNS